MAALVIAGFVLMIFLEGLSAVFLGVMAVIEDLTQEPLLLMALVVVLLIVGAVAAFVPFTSIVGVIVAMGAVIGSVAVAAYGGVQWVVIFPFTVMCDYGFEAWVIGIASLICVWHVTVLLEGGDCFADEAAFLIIAAFTFLLMPVYTLLMIVMPIYDMETFERWWAVIVVLSAVLVQCQISGKYLDIPTPLQVLWDWATPDPGPGPWYPTKRGGRRTAPLRSPHHLNEARLKAPGRC